MDFESSRAGIFITITAKEHSMLVVGFFFCGRLTNKGKVHLDPVSTDPFHVLEFKRSTPPFSMTMVIHQLLFLSPRGKMLRIFIKLGMTGLFEKNYV